MIACNPRPRIWPTVLLVALWAATLGGCANMPGQPEVTEYEAKYTDLANRSVAVVVSVRDYTEFNFPTARPTLTNDITRRIQLNVPGVTMSNPIEILKWQDENPYWHARPASALIEQLGVERLVLVEVGKYSTHEPGDKFLLRGVISAVVNVAEAEAADPDTYGFAYKKLVEFPRSRDSKLGRAESTAVNEEKIEKQTQAWFCEEVAGLFYDHEQVR